MKIKIIFYKFDVLEIIIIFQTIVEKKNLIIQFQEFLWISSTQCKTKITDN